MKLIEETEEVPLGTLVRAQSGHSLSYTITNSEAVCEVVEPDESGVYSNTSMTIKVITIFSGWTYISHIDPLYSQGYFQMKFRVSKNQFYRCNEYGIPLDLVEKLEETVLKYHPNYNRFEDLE